MVWRLARPGDHRVGTENRPYNIVFIDADHSYEAAPADWLNYGPLGKIVGFHDIIGEVGVRQLWAELKAAYQTEEFAQSHMGIGVVVGR